MTLLTHLISIGRDTTFRAIASNRKEMPKGSPIILWVYLIAGLDPTFLTRVRPLVDDMIVSTVNYCDFSAAVNLLYLPYHIFLYQSDDCELLPGSIDTALHIMTKHKRVGAYGTLTQKEGMKQQLAIDDPEQLPDMGLLLNKEAINEVGGLRPTFPSYGYAFQELVIRMNMRQWHMITVRDGHADHIGDAHFGSNQIVHREDVWAKNKKVFNELKKNHFPVDGWWRS